MRACWLKWIGRDWSISADYIWLNYSGANTHRNNRAESLSRSRLANPNSSDFPVIRNIWGSSRPSPENPMLEATMPRGYSVSFSHPRQGKGRDSL